MALLIKLKKIFETIDSILLRIGKVVSFVNFILLVAIVLNVIMRYGFRSGQVWLEELQWYCYSLAAMIGMSYSDTLNSQVRVDILYHSLGAKKKAVVNLFGILFLLLPWIIIIFKESLPFVYDSFRLSESSSSPIGLPYRWIIKSVIPVSFLFLGLATISSMLKNFLILCNISEEKNGRK